MNNYTSSHIGTLTQSGKDFGILASNVPFKMLYKYDAAVRKNSNSIGSSSYDISGKIANSIIICAPQEKDNTTLYTQWTKFSYYDNDSDGKFSDLDSGSTYSYTTIDSKPDETYKDNGEFDLVVTDSDGVPVCVTPPFNDIDTEYFAVEKNLDSRYRDYTTGQVLTLSERFGNNLSNVNKTLDELIYTYTPIVPSKEKTIYLITTYKVGNPNNKDYYIGYTGNGGNILISQSNGKWTYSYSPDEDTTIVNDATTSFTKVSFTYLLDWNIELQKWRDKEFPQGDKIDDKWDKDPYGNSINSKISYLLDKVNQLWNAKYMYRLENSSTSYIWTGTKSDYDNKLGSDKNRKDVTFILNEK